ncbi:MAG TPA: hypothetical protein GX527_01240 [Clostridiaceae bacterium]|jgi:hypothetical protein|nr:hypothetical protein [Clostridiaceae bacterium]
MCNKISTDGMGFSDSNSSYLEMMRDVFEVSSVCSVKTYIWGGFVIDIFEGKFLREHGDLDGFVENMMSVLGACSKKQAYAG